MALRCGHCDQSVLATDTVCWHCGKELESARMPVGETPEMREPTKPKEDEPISITAVSVFTLITLITIIIFIIVTNALAGFAPG